MKLLIFKFNSYQTIYVNEYWESPKVKRSKAAIKNVDFGFYPYYG